MKSSLEMYPSINAAELSAAWNYVASHLAEIDDAISSDNECLTTNASPADRRASRYPCCRSTAGRHGHDVRTVRQECENKFGDGLDDKTVLQYAIQ